MIRVEHTTLNGKNYVTIHGVSIVINISSMSVMLGQAYYNRDAVTRYIRDPNTQLRSSSLANFVDGLWEEERNMLRMILETWKDD